MKRMLLMAVLALMVGCSDTTGEAIPPDAASDSPAVDAGNAPLLELTPDLCDDPSKLALLMDAMSAGGDGPSFGEVNTEQVLRMTEAPTEGPFYMVNLIRYREQARYADGRATDLTGREADALYSPIEFITAIGAQIVFVGDVASTTTGAEDAWDVVAIVEYPCPLAFFAMAAHPEFQARAVHKEAGVEATIVMVTHRQPLEETEPANSPFPATADDPAFEWVRVNRYREQAQYSDDANEPSRTGQEAMDLYMDSVRDAEKQLGVYPKARLKVQGVFIGDGREWNEVWIDFVPSNAAFEALAADPSVAAAQHHLEAALEDAYGLVTHPMISTISGDGGGLALPPVTADGTGTLCQTDDDCPGNGVDKCFKPDGTAGFCSREGCGPGQCESPYLCCRDCSAVVASMLPFEGSICLPDIAVAQLTAAPASCTCD